MYLKHHYPSIGSVAYWVSYRVPGFVAEVQGRVGI